MVNTRFYAWLTSELNKREMSNNELARRAGVSSGLVSLVLSGQRGISTDFCIKVARALNLPTNDVLRRAGFSTVPDAQADLSADEAELVAAYRRLSPDMRGRAVAILQVLAD